VSANQQSLPWRRSSACAQGDCVEVAYCDDRVLMRNSAEPEVVLEMARSTWAELISSDMIWAL
jgi:hypothetical protein